jgi:hypothetical protein
LIPAEGKQLAGERGSSLRDVMYEHNVLHHGVVSLEPIQHHFAPAHYDGQQIIEVVRDAARKPAHGFHSDFSTVAIVLLHYDSFLAFHTQ